MAIFNEIRSYRRLEIYSTLALVSSRATTRGAEPSSEQRRTEDKVSLQFFTGALMPRCSYTAQEFLLLSREHAWAAAEPPEVHLGTPNHE